MRTLCIPYPAGCHRPRALAWGGALFPRESFVTVGQSLWSCLPKLALKALCVDVLYAFFVVRPPTARDPAHARGIEIVPTGAPADGQSFCSSCQGRLVFVCLSHGPQPSPVQGTFCSLISLITQSITTILFFPRSLTLLWCIINDTYQAVYY